MPEEAGRENLSHLLYPPLSTELLEQGCHTDRSLLLPPPPALEPWLRDSAWKEKQAVKQVVAPNFSPKELTLFAMEHREIQL